MAAFIKSLIDFLKAKLFGGIEDGIFVFTDAKNEEKVRIERLNKKMHEKVRLSYLQTGDFVL